MKRYLFALMVTATACAQQAAPVHLTLNEAIDQALRQNRTLELARLEVSGKQREKDEARSHYFPQLSNESQASHITELQGVTLPKGALGNNTPVETVTVGQGASTSYLSRTMLNQPMTQLFKVHEGNKAAAAGVKVAEIELEDARDTVALKVRQVYYGVLIAQWKKHAAEQQLKASEASLQEAHDQVQRGEALDVSELESRASVLQARQDLLTEQLAISDTSLTLAYLLGLPVNTVFDLDETSANAAVDLPSRAEGIRRALTESPEVRSAKATVERARAGLAVARDAYIPDVTAYAHYNYQSGIPFLVHNFGAFGVAFHYELFDGGKREAELGKSRIQLRQAEVKLADVTAHIEAEANAAYDKVERMQGLAHLAEEVKQVRAEAARVKTKQVELHAALPSQQITAEAQLSSSTASAMEANLGLVLAQGELRKTLGLGQHE
ncbi:TolC family protein [Terriglobus tenax]|uniref:TolC family protein n=1 Tax=Terriglobus tenax TaxID=1111115 RepID=UPI0021DFD9F7|nr:TolC family protein [Terriglobus tenax]